MNWKNVDLNSNYEKSKNLLENYTFEQLILEAICNIKNTEVTEEAIKKHALEVINAKLEEAKGILNDNLSNITKYVIDYNKMP